jgi:uncharacterized protein YpmS
MKKTLAVLFISAMVISCTDNNQNTQTNSNDSIQSNTLNTGGDTLNRMENVTSGGSTIQTTDSTNTQDSTNR